MEGTSGRAVGRILKISKNTCLNWIRKRAKTIAPKDRSNERVEIIEMDELFSFKERKKPIYIITEKLEKLSAMILLRIDQLNVFNVSWTIRLKQPSIFLMLFLFILRFVMMVLMNL